MLKKNRKKQFLTAVFALLFALSSIMSIHIPAQAVTAKKVKKVALKIKKKTVTKKIYSLDKGKKATLKVIVTPKKAKKSITYKSSNKKVATVSKKGVVKAKKRGTAKITVTVKGKNKKSKKTWVKIKVKEKASPENKTQTQTPSVSYNVKVTEIEIADGTSKVYGKLYTPDKEGVYPAIIMSHGYNGINEDFAKECRYFAQNGYVACAYDFCGGSTRSKSSGKSTDMTIFTEKSNLTAVYNHIKSLGNVDKTRIFLHGGSQGGLVTALTAEELKDEIKGMILYFPALNIPDDWRRTFKNVSDIPATYDFWGLTLGRAFFTSIHDFDTFKNIGTFSKNVLILYGMKDPIVLYSYMEKAKSTYPNCRLVTYPDEAHGFSPSGGDKAMQETLSFMKKQ